MTGCALVSTSGSLLRHHYGPAIDAHDVVVRTGTAPLRGFERHVGNRTDFRVMSPWHINLRQLSRVLRSETIVYTKAVGHDCAVVHRKLHRPDFPDLKYTCFDSRHDHNCSLMSSSRDTSTGLEAFSFAFLRLPCASLTLYGFTTREALDMPYHYYTDGSARDNKTGRVWYKSRSDSRWGHDFIKEHEALYALSTNWNISRSSFHGKCP